MALVAIELKKMLKQFLLIILVLSSINLLGQGSTVKFLQQSCEINRSDGIHRKISIFYGDSLIVQNQKTKYGELTINNLEYGTYKVRFTNIFGQKIDEIVQIDSTTSQIVICTDRFKDTNDTTLISKLYKSDTLILNYSFTSTKIHNAEKMIFYFDKDNWCCDIYVDNKKYASRKLSERDINLLIEFEKQLRQMTNNTGWCSTTEFYEISLNGEIKLTIKDKSCRWKGYSKIKWELLIKK